MEKETSDLAFPCQLAEQGEGKNSGGVAICPPRLDAVAANHGPSDKVGGWGSRAGRACHSPAKNIPLSPAYGAGAGLSQRRELNVILSAILPRDSEHMADLLDGDRRHRRCLFFSRPGVLSTARLPARQTEDKQGSTFMRKPIVAANWKMNMTASEAADYHHTLCLEIGELSGVEIVIAPPFTAIPKLSELIGASDRLRLGAQNLYHEKHGAFTGEISAAMLREHFVRYVIIGHSERRQLFGETDELVHKKVAAALASELRPILCVGETLQERQAGKEKAVIERQLESALRGVKLHDFGDLVIAYEPVWAIGTGVNATPEQAQEAHAFIRECLAAFLGAEAAPKVRIQYGGSVKPSNAKEILQQPDVDGALVGGASLDPRGFAQIVRAAVPA